MVLFGRQSDIDSSIVDTSDGGIISDVIVSEIPSDADSRFRARVKPKT